MPQGCGSSGGFRPVSCYLEAVHIDVKPLGAHPALWGALYDNPWDTNVLSSIPSGLGVSFLFNGTDATITTTVAGVWNLTLLCSTAVLPGDAWRATVRDSMLALQTVPPSSSNTSEVTIGSQYSLPAAAFFAPECLTQVGGNGVSQTLLADFHLVIVRLA